MINASERRGRGTEGVGRGVRRRLIQVPPSLSQPSRELGVNIVQQSKSFWSGGARLYPPTSPDAAGPRKDMTLVKPLLAAEADPDEADSWRPSAAPPSLKLWNASFLEGA